MYMCYILGGIFDSSVWVLMAGFYKMAINPPAQRKEKS